MYFDGQNFPAKSAVGWVSARDLRHFDATNKNSLVPHIQSVRKFLKARAEKRSPEQGVDGPKSEAPDTTERSSTVANNNPLTPLKGESDIYSLDRLVRLPYSVPRQL